MATYPARHVSVSIERPPAEVYAFASKPENLSRWAQGLSALGDVKIRFAPPNSFGVLDHDVTLGSGLTVHNPMRVVPNGSGSEVVFTIFHRPEMTGAELEADAAAVARDLAALKRLLEA